MTPASSIQTSSTFYCWVDDERKRLWGDFEQDKPNLAELPWIKRDAKEAESLKLAMQGHTTPVKIPNLAAVTAETVIHDMYSQPASVNVQSTPPPSVTIPMDRVNPKDVIVDSQLGAAQPVAPGQQGQAAQPIGQSTAQSLPPLTPSANPAPLDPSPRAPGSP